MTASAAVRLGGRESHTNPGIIIGMILHPGEGGGDGRHPAPDSGFRHHRAAGTNGRNASLYNGGVNGRRLLGITAAALPLAALLVWVFLRATAPAPGPRTAVPAPLAGGLPSAAAVGAVRRSEIERFAGDGVYDYLDGGAEAYLARGLETVVVTRYEFAGPGGARTEIEAAVMRFATPGGAAASAVELRPLRGRPVEGLEGAVAGPGELVMARGRRVLRLLATPPATDADPRLARIAAAWIAATGDADAGS